jgi:hypothetical protein
VSVFNFLKYGLQLLVLHILASNIIAPFFSVKIVLTVCQSFNVLYAANICVCFIKPNFCSFYAS